MTEAGGSAVHWYGPESAPVLLLMHGLTDSGLCWPDAVARWSRAYRIAALDALGHGESRRFTTAELERAPVSAMYEQTLLLARELSDQGRQVIAIGHSMGGGVAAAIAREPGLFTAVVLEEPAWLDDDERDPRSEAAEWLSTTSAFIRDPAAALAAGRAENPSWPESEFAPWALAKRQTDVGFLSVGEAVLPQSWTSIASSIAVPARVITGTRDVIMSAGKLERMRSLGNPLIESAVIPGAGHCVRRDNPREFHEIVDAWLAEFLA